MRRDADGLTFWQREERKITGFFINWFLMNLALSLPLTAFLFPGSTGVYQQYFGFWGTAAYAFMAVNVTLNAPNVLVLFVHGAGLWLARAGRE